jgi:hypothetical protein
LLQLAVRRRAQGVAIEVEGRRRVDALTKRERYSVRLRIHWGGNRGAIWR